MKYIIVPSGKLPRGFHEFGHKIGEVSHSGESVSVNLPGGVEYYCDKRMNEVFDVSSEGRRLKMTLRETPSESNGITGDYSVYMRLGSLFTKVVVGVVL